MVGKVAVAKRIATETAPIVESAIPSAIPLSVGFAGGLALGSAANLVGGAAGVLVTALTRIPLKVTALLGSMGSGAYVVNYLGHSPFSIGLKVGVVTASVFWATRAGSGQPGEGIVEHRRLTWQRNGYLTGYALAAGLAYFGNPALGLLAGGIVGNIIAQVGREPAVAPQNAQANRAPAVQARPDEA